MTNIEDHRLPLVVMKLPLLSAAPTTSVAEFRGVEHRVPFTVRVEPADGLSPRACLTDEPALIGLMAPLVSKANVLGPLHEPLKVQPSQFGREISRGLDSDVRARAVNSLGRLANTLVTTDYGAFGRRDLSKHSLLTIESAPSNGDWIVSLSPLLIDQVFRRQVIKPPADYFDARGLRRRIWSLALAFCGKRREFWRMPMLELWRRSGSIDAARKFAFAIERFAAESSVPGFKLSTERELGRRFVRFAHAVTPPATTPQAALEELLGIEPEFKPAPTIIHLNLDEDDQNS